MAAGRGGTTAASFLTMMVGLGSSGSRSARSSSIAPCFDGGLVARRAHSMRIANLLTRVGQHEEIARHATNHNAVAQKKRAPTVWRPPRLKLVCEPDMIGAPAPTISQLGMFTVAAKPLSRHLILPA